MAEIITIEKPHLTDEIEFAAYQYYKKNSDHLPSRELEEIFQKTENPKYLPWKELKRKAWLPKDISAESFWYMLKLFRRGGKNPSVVRTKSDELFYWKKLPRFEKTLHEIDSTIGKKTFETTKLTEKNKSALLTEGLIEESIASSQIEGAHTTREFAKKMIQENRKPTDHSQRMILNNYKLMKRIESETKNEKLSVDILLNLHAELTHDTLKSKDQEGRFRTDKENIYIGNDTGEASFIPPNIEFVKKDINLLIGFANDEFDLDNRFNTFTHPIVKAIILHFWLAYLHPFVDGNGRMARALFYWYLLRKGYWMFAYLPISTCIKKSQKSYADAYLYSEQDDNDLTYFIDYNIRKIEEARDEFRTYIERKKTTLSNETELTKKFPDFNSRQIRLIQFFRAKPDERTNMSSMVQLYGITAPTAVKDLKTLEQQGLLYKRKNGSNVFYYPTEKLLGD